ncbi:hypothetical protein B0H14DRAFT_2948789 [Mycena olivaceomarginata]|nr:hypothetical protein B0H14DRAFT_2948789 [Mycena olivaceomarginata]
MGIGAAQRAASPPPPPPPPLSMAAVLRSRTGAVTPSSAYPAPWSAASSGSGPASAYPSAAAYGPSSAHGPASSSASSASTPSSARSTPSGFAWRYSGEGTDSPMTAATTPATSRDGGAWGDDQRKTVPTRKSTPAVAASPLAQSASAGKRIRRRRRRCGRQFSPQNKRERRRLRLHSPVEVGIAQTPSPEERELPVPPLTPPIHSHPLEDEGDGTGPESALEAPDDGRGWLATLEGEVREQEMDGLLLSPPTFAAADPQDFDPDDDELDLNDFDDGYLDDPNRLDTRIRARVERSPSPIRYARRASVDVDLILSDSSDEEEDNMSDLDRAPSAYMADATSFDSPAASVFNDSRSTFSRARSTRSRRKRRNTRAAPPPVPLGSAAGLHRPRARSADSSILGFGDIGLAPSEMYRMEQAARAAKAALPPVPVQEMRYVYQAAAARLPASIPPSPAMLLGRGSDGSSQYDSASASVSGHGHGSSESGQPHGRGSYYASPSTSKSSLPEKAPSRRETLKQSKKEKKEREKAEKEREKAMRKSIVPHRASFSLLRGGSGTANSSAEALMMRGATERASSSSGGSDEVARPQRANKNVLFRSLYGDPTRR